MNPGKKKNAYDRITNQKARKNIPDTVKARGKGMANRSLSLGAA